MRAESARFTLTSFSLDMGRPPLEVTERLARFLEGEPVARTATVHGRFQVRRSMIDAVTVSWCEFDAGGRLVAVTPVFDRRIPLPGPEVLGAAIRGVIQAHGQTRHLPEAKRARAMGELVDGACRGEVREVAWRLLRSCCISFERTVPGNRFRPPEFRLRRGLGWGSLSAVFRPSPSGRGTDLWLHCHHAAVDGAPMQELIERLEARQGLTERVALPPAGSGESVQECQAEGERPAGLVTGFFDFAPLTALRRELPRSPAFAEASIPVGALLLWCMARQPEFAGVGISTAVDVPATDGEPRAVDLVTAWPGRYPQKAWGLAAFLRDFGELVEKGRHRSSGTWRGMRMLTMLPGAIGQLVLRDDAGTRRKFGSMSVSILRGSKLFLPPYPDTAWDRGFAGIGQIGVASESGPPVTAVSFKGDPARIGSYPDALRRAIAECREAVGS